jgi:predicted transposase YbfD/YdcC
MIESSFTRSFITIGDWRQEGKVRHILFEVIFIAVAAFIARSEDWIDVVIWAEEKTDWLKKFCDLPYGIPSISTFQRVFRAINPKQFEKCFIAWTREISGETSGRHVAVDGKTLRGAKEGANEKSPVHIVSAWCSYNGLSLGGIKTNEKSNEITAIPELLDLLAVDGSIITIDAMGTQTKIAEKIVKDNHADYVFGLKQNQPSMFSDVALATLGVDFEFAKSFEEPEKTNQKALESAMNISSIYAKASSNEDILKALRLAFPDLSFLDLDPQFLQNVEKGHGRIEKRQSILFSAGSWMQRFEEWAGLKSIGVIFNTITNIKTGIQSFDYSFYITTLNDVRSFAHAVRQHWGIEAYHWVLDVSFGEDKSRIRKDNEPQNVAVVRKIVHNLVGVQRTRMADEAGKTYKPSYKSVRFRALLAEKFLEQVMFEHNLK